VVVVVVAWGIVAVVDGVLFTGSWWYGIEESVGGL
jgi:hypothetical protein